MDTQDKNNYCFNERLIDKSNSLLPTNTPSCVAVKTIGENDLFGFVFLVMGFVGYFCQPILLYNSKEIIAIYIPTRY